jgi:hypothetical protein
MQHLSHLASIAISSMILVGCGSDATSLGDPPDEHEMEVAISEVDTFALEPFSSSAGSTLVADGIWLEQATTFELEVQDGSANLSLRDDVLTVQALTIALSGLDHMFLEDLYLDDMTLVLEEPVVLDAVTSDDEVRAEGLADLRVDWWVEGKSDTHQLASQEANDIPLEIVVETTADGTLQLGVRLRQEGEVFSLDGIFDVAAIDVMARGRDQ